MKLKDFRAFSFFIIFSLVLWQFGESIKRVCLKSGGVLDNPVFSITYAQNKGGAWSILENHTNLLIFISITVLLISVFYVYKEITFKNKFPLLSVSVFAGGILGNLIERISSGYVTDYIKLNFINFPTFNIFDTMICIGFAIYFLSEFYNEIKNGKSNKN